VSKVMQDVVTTTRKTVDSNSTAQADLPRSNQSSKTSITPRPSATQSSRTSIPAYPTAVQSHIQAKPTKPKAKPRFQPSQRLSGRGLLHACCTMPKAEPRIVWRPYSATGAPDAHVSVNAHARGGQDKIANQAEPRYGRPIRQNFDFKLCRDSISSCNSRWDSYRNDL
jgi:hypothetical protein